MSKAEIIDDETPHNEERGVWSNKVDFFLSAIGYAGTFK